MARQGAERRVVRQVDVPSVARMAFAISLTVTAIILVGLIALYVLGAASGALDAVESFVESLGWENFQVRFFGLLPIFILFAAIGSGVATALAAVAAVGYNILSELVGGIEVQTREH